MIYLNFLAIWHKQWKMTVENRIANKKRVSLGEENGISVGKMWRKIKPSAKANEQWKNNFPQMSFIFISSFLIWKQCKVYWRAYPQPCVNEVILNFHPIFISHIHGHTYLLIEINTLRQTFWRKRGVHYSFIILWWVLLFSHVYLGQIT